MLRRLALQVQALSHQEGPRAGRSMALCRLRRHRRRHRRLRPRETGSVKERGLGKGLGKG